MISKEDRLKYLGFNDTTLSLIAIPAIGFLFPILFYGALINDYSWYTFKLKWAEATLHAGVFWFLLRSLMIHLRKRYSEFEQTGQRIMIQSGLFLILGFVLGSFFHFLFAHTLCPILGINDYHSHDTGENPLLATYFTGFAVLTGYEAKYFYYQLRNSIEEREEAKQAQIRSELEGLRNQVNPHFLFNSMNTLMNLVVADQQLAVSFLKKLSKVYRYVLESRDEQLIPLKKELEFIHSYVFLQEERFKGNFEVDITIHESYLCHKIIPLSLQILFENAVKHNIISRKKPLRIEVFIKDDMLVVRNNLQLKEQVMHSTKVGLENIKTRYKYFTNKEVELVESTDFFTVKIPIIKVPIKKGIQDLTV